MRIERVVVTGGRKFADGARIEADLRALVPFGLRRVAQGGNGIDKQFGGAEWPKTPNSADALAWLATCAISGVSEATYRVNLTVADDDDGNRAPTWTGNDGAWPAAGNRRNVRMLDAEKPDLVLAYPDPESRGTWHCVKAALARNIPVAIWAPHMLLIDVATCLKPLVMGTTIDCYHGSHRFAVGAIRSISEATRTDRLAAIVDVLRGVTV